MTYEAAVGSTKEDVANYEDEYISAHSIDTCVRKTEIWNVCAKKSTECNNSYNARYW